MLYSDYVSLKPNFVEVICPKSKTNTWFDIVVLY